MNFASEGLYIGFSGSKEVNGLTLSGGANLDSSTFFGASEGDDENAVWDKTYASIGGGFGRVEMGNKNDAGESAGTANYLDVSGYGFDGIYFGFDYGHTGFPGGATRLDRGKTRVTYYSPNINGLTFGFSMLESGGNGEIDLAKEAASGNARNVYLGTGDDAGKFSIGGAAYANNNQPALHTSGTSYVVKYSGAGVNFAYGGGTNTDTVTISNAANNVTVNSTSTAASGEYSNERAFTRLNFSYSIAGATIGYSTHTSETTSVRAGTGVNRPTGDGALADADINGTVLGLQYKTGAIGVSFVQATEDVADPANTTAATDATGTILGLSYQVNDGIVVGLSSVSADAAPDQDNTAAFGTSGGTVVNVSIAF